MYFANNFLGIIRTESVLWLFRVICWVLSFNTTMPSDSIKGRPCLAQFLSLWVLKMLVHQKSVDQQTARPHLSLYQTSTTLNDHVHIVSTSERGLMVSGHD